MHLLYDSKYIDGYPRWFADGKRIAFHQIDDNRESRVFLADLSEYGDIANVRQITSGPFDIEPAPSPDGTRIAYSAAGESGRTLPSLILIRTR